MLFDVYIYRDDPVEALKDGPRTGELVVKSLDGVNGLTATLYQPGTRKALISPMRHAHIVAMNATSMVLEGSQTFAERNNVKSRTNTFKVQWVVKHVGAPAVVDSKRLQQRSAQRLHAAFNHGFDPVDDNNAS